MVNVDIRQVAKIMGYKPSNIELLPKTMGYDNRVIIENTPFEDFHTRFEDYETVDQKALVSVIITASGFNEDAMLYMDEWIFDALNDYLSRGENTGFFKHNWKAMEKNNTELFNDFRSSRKNFPNDVERLKKIYDFEEVEMPFSRESFKYFISAVLDDIDRQLTIASDEIKGYPKGIKNKERTYIYKYLHDCLEDIPFMSDDAWDYIEQHPTKDLLLVKIDRVGSNLSK